MANLRDSNLSGSNLSGRRADMFIDLEDDPREDCPTLGDERTTLVEVLREEGLAGATVLKGIAGFGHDRNIHTINIEVAAFGLPLIIEVVDTEEHINRVLPKIEALMEGGVIMLERAHVIRYAKRPSTAS